MAILMPVGLELLVCGVPPVLSMSERTEADYGETISKHKQAVKGASIDSRYGYEPSSTTEVEAGKNLSSWLDNIRQSLNNLPGNLIVRAIPTHIINSPISERLPNVTQANVATLVSPEGKIVGEPELIRSSGYPMLNQLAIQDIKKRSFPPSGKYEIYLYQIEIEQ